MAIKIQENENQHLAYSEQRSSDQEQQQLQQRQLKLQLQLLSEEQLHKIRGGSGGTEVIAEMIKRGGTTITTIEDLDYLW